MSSLSSRVSEVEQELETARKDLIKSEEMNNKYQRDIKEVRLHTCRTETTWVHPFVIEGKTLFNETLQRLAVTSNIWFSTHW